MTTSMIILVLLILIGWIAVSSGMEILKFDQKIREVEDQVRPDGPDTWRQEIVWTIQEWGDLWPEEVIGHDRPQILGRWSYVECCDQLYHDGILKEEITREDFNTFTVDPHVGRILSFRGKISRAIEEDIEKTKTTTP